MAAPTVTIKLNTGATDEAPTWTTVGSDTITFTGSGSSDADLKAIPRPTSTGVTTAHELWVNSGTDLQCSAYDGGGQTTNSYAVDMFASDPVNGNIISIEITVNPETQAAEMEAWDTTSYVATTTEMISGTTNLGVHSQLRAVETGNAITFGDTDTTIPAGYQAQTADDTTWQLQGDTRGFTFTSACVATECNRIALHLFVVDDSAAGSDTCELTYKYFYT